MNSNQANLAFEREVQNASSWLNGRISGSCGYSPAVLQDRLMQRLVEIALRPYITLVAGLSKSGDDCLPCAGTRIDCGHAFLEVGSGRIGLTLFRWLRNQAEFLIHWAYCLTAIVSISRRRDTSSPAVLVFGVGEESLFQGGSDRRFVSFCQAGPVGPLRDGRRFLIQSTTKGARSSDKSFSYCRFPLVGLLRTSRLGIMPRMVMTIKHFVLLFNYSFSALLFPSLTLLARDFAYGGISTEMDRFRLIDSVVLTGSNYTSQPLWTRVLPHSKVHMVWYSQSAQPIIYNCNGIESDTPNLRWIRIGTLWLWTHALADYARRLIPMAKIEVVGPILWYLPETGLPPSERLNIQIFDIPALTDEIALSVGLFPNYMSVANLSAFIDDILGLKTVLEEYFHLPVAFSLKTKRQYNHAYDRKYFDYLEHLSSTGKIILEHYENNMYSLITKSHLVIVYPFSSPAYVADSVGVPTIYYDPTGSIVRCDFSDPPSLIQFANTRKKLHELSLKVLGLGFQ